MPQQSKNSFQARTYSKLSDLPNEFREALKPSLEKAYDASLDFGSTGYLANGSYYNSFDDIPIQIIRSSEYPVYECSFMNDDFIVHEIQTAEEIRVYPGKQAFPQSERSNLRVRLDTTNGKLFILLATLFVLLFLTYILLQFIDT